MSTAKDIMVAGRVSAVQGTSTDGQGISHGAPSGVKYRVIYGRGDGTVETPYLAPQNPRPNVDDIIAAKVGDPASVYIFGGVAEICVWECAYFSNCPES